MVDICLEPQPFLGGYARDFGDTRLVEITDMALISLAMPLGGRDKLQKTIKSLWGCDLPDPGKSAAANPPGTRLLCLGPDSFMALLDGNPDPAQESLQGAGYTTDQSDNWVILRLAGSLALPALERICPIDLHGQNPGDFARTAMEHMGAIILREGERDFLLLSASSSAKSFLHAVETSIENVMP